MRVKGCVTCKYRLYEAKDEPCLSCDFEDSNYEEYNTEDIKKDFCDNYCRFPHIWNPEEHDGQELWESTICEHCPSNFIKEV